MSRVACLVAAGLGVLALGGAPGSLRIAAAAGAGAHAGSTAVGDQWVWPGPPNVDSDLPAFFDARRHTYNLMQARSSTLEIWSLPTTGVQTWTLRRLALISNPFARPNQWVYDAVGDRLLMLGDYFVPTDTDTCCPPYRMQIRQLSLSDPPTWSALPTRGTDPIARGDAAMIMDSRRQRLVVFGGEPRYGTRFTTPEVDVFDLAADTASWTVLDVGSPPIPEAPGSAVYDSLSDRIFTWGGSDSLYGGQFPRLLSLDLAAPVGWEALSLPDTLPVRSISTGGSRLFDDPEHSRVLLAATFYAYDSVAVWGFDPVQLQGWNLVTAVGRSGSYGFSQAMLDPERNAMALCAGTNRNDIVELPLDGSSSWRRVQKSNRVPRLATGDGFVFDARRNRVIALDGRYSIAPLDVWILQRGAIDDWEERQTNQLAPTSRPYAATVYDSLGDRVLIYGGRVGTGELGDLWQLTIPDSVTVTWKRLFPEGEPPTPRWGASVIYDAARHRVVLYGGYGGGALADTWELLLDPPLRWHRLPDRGFPPPGRFGATAVYDSRRDAMLIYGGNVGTADNPQLVDETWALSFADGDVWVPVPTVGRPPSPRWGSCAIYDPQRDRVLVSWGAAYNTPRIDCGELDLASGPTWNSYAPGGMSPAGRAFSGAFYDAVSDQELIVGGDDSSAPTTIVDDFSSNPVTSPPPLAGLPLAVLGLAPNPTRDIENVAFELPVDATVRARIYDARGRLVRDLGPRRYVAGGHILLWDGRNRLGEIPPSGVYFAKLSILGKDFTGKFVLLH